jgi:TrmH family RNA methyltransferase
MVGSIKEAREMKIAEASKKTINFTKQLATDKKIRDEESKFIIEGEKIIKDSLSKPIHYDYFIASASYVQNNGDLVNEIHSKKIPLYQIKEKNYASLSKLVSGPGIIGVAEKIKRRFNDFLRKESYSVILGDRIQDPANLGSMMRLAVAFDMDAILLTPDSADIYNPKTVRASSGAVIDLPAYTVSWDDVAQLKEDALVFTAMPYRQDKTVLLENIKEIPKKFILAFGSEGSGVSEEYKKMTDTFFTIKTNPAIESLNVAQSTAISLYHFYNL